MKGLLKYLAPFAPDQSGASGVLYGLGGLIVICDAGGCTGNICGFDEPRWFLREAAEASGVILSAGLRDMDAILGRDDQLIEKLKIAAASLGSPFAALVGTPVPAVIGTDFQALRRMAERRCHLPILAVPCTGTYYYDAGEETAYIELFKRFAGKMEFAPGEEISRKDSGTLTSPAETGKDSPDAASPAETGKDSPDGASPAETGKDSPDGASPAETGKDSPNGASPAETRKVFSDSLSPAETGKVFSDLLSTAETGKDSPENAPSPVPGRLGVIGASPLNLSTARPVMRLKEALHTEDLLCYGAAGGLAAVALAPTAEKNLVLSPSGLSAAKYLRERFGTPYEVACPLLPGDFPEIGESLAGKRALVIHQQVLANEARKALRSAGCEDVTVATFFRLEKELAEPGDLFLSGEEELAELLENGGFDLIAGDQALARCTRGCSARWIHLPHFAVSGECADTEA